VSLTLGDEHIYEARVSGGVLQDLVVMDEERQDAWSLLLDFFVGFRGQQLDRRVQHHRCLKLVLLEGKRAALRSKSDARARQQPRTRSPVTHKAKELDYFGTVPTQHQACLLSISPDHGRSKIKTSLLALRGRH
jgi:hypothetical protein